MRIIIILFLLGIKCTVAQSSYDIDLLLKTFNTACDNNFYLTKNDRRYIPFIEELLNDSIIDPKECSFLSVHFFEMRYGEKSNDKLIVEKWEIRDTNSRSYLIKKIKSIFYNTIKESFKIKTYDKPPKTIFYTSNRIYVIILPNTKRRECLYKIQDILKNNNSFIFLY